MKDLPLKSVPSLIDRNFLPIRAKPQTNEGVQKNNEQELDQDASIVSVPKSKTRAASSADAGAVLQSFLSEIGKGTDVVSAHSGLDASRVFDLLNDNED